MMRTGSKLWIILLAISLFVVGCKREPSTDSPAPAPESVVTIKSIEILEGSASSTRTSPGKLEEWKALTNSSKLPVFDVVIKLQNPGASSLQEADLIVLTTIDFVVAPTYLHDGDVHRVIENGSWSRLVAVDDVKKQSVPYMRSGDIGEVRINGFDLSELLIEFNGAEETLWPWALRVNVHLMNREMRQVAFGHATLRIIPADTRLASK